MPGNLNIESIGTYLPENRVTSSETVRDCQHVSRLPLERYTGIASRPVAAEDEYCIDIAQKAVSVCMERSAFSIAEIDLLVVSSISRLDGPRCNLSYEPSMSHRLACLLGMKNFHAFDLSNACAGNFSALWTIDALTANNPDLKTLLVSAERITHLTECAQREIRGMLDPRVACLTLGDSGVAMTLERSKGDAGFVDIDWETLGGFSDLCIGKASDEPHGGAIMHTDSSGLKKLAIPNCARHAQATMRRNGWSPKSVKAFIPHQTAARAIDDYSKQLNHNLGEKVLTRKNVVYNLANRGNLATNTHWVALQQSLYDTRIKANDRVTFTIAASGFTYGTALYQAGAGLVSDNNGDSQTNVTVENPDQEQGLAPCRKLRQTNAAIESVQVWRPDAGKKQDTIAMAVQAAEACLKQTACDRSMIDLVIFSGIYRSEVIAEPSIAAILAGRLQINDGSTGIGSRATRCFDIASGALGTFQACHLALELFHAGKSQRALIVAGEADHADYWVGRDFDIEECASAILLSANGEAGSGLTDFFFTFRSDPASLALQKSNLQLEGPQKVGIREDAPDSETASVQCMVDSVSRAMSDLNLNGSPFKVVTGDGFRQALAGALRDSLGINENQVISPNQGVSRDPFTSLLAMSHQGVVEEKRCEKGEIVLYVQAEAGTQACCASYRV